MTEGFLADLDHAVSIEEKYFSECFETEDQREGMKAFWKNGKWRNSTIDKRRAWAFGRTARRPDSQS